MTKEIATKANALIEASYRFELLEMQIILYGVSLVNPVSQEFPTSYIIDVNRFAEIFNKDKKNIYRELKNTVLGKFWERDLTYVLENGEAERIRWLITASYKDKKGYLKIEFHPTLKPYLHQLSKNFTVYYIEKISKFTSFYSVRVYEMLIMRLNLKGNNYLEVTLGLCDLKEALALSDRYTGRYNNFKARILNKAREEINAHSDLLIDFEEIKKGRAVESIKFIVTRKDGCQRAKYQPENETSAETNKPELPSAEEVAEAVQKEELKDKLNQKYGIHAGVAAQLVDTYPLDQIKAVLCYIDRLIQKDNYNVDGIQNRAAYTVQAIKHNWTSTMS